MSTKLSKQQAIHELWRRGNLQFKCHAVQLEMRELFYGSPNNSTLVWVLSRQTGKSFMMAILALEQAIKKSNSIIKLLTDTKLHVRTIFEPIFNMLLEDCPEDAKPSYSKSDYCYTFPNGSQIQMAGSDNGHAERLRGQKSDLVLVDEAGFCDDLDNVVSSILLPTTTHTGGRIVLASTPSPDPDHQFYIYVEKAEIDGLLTTKTIYDNPLLTEKQVERIIKEMGGVNSPKFRREYLCQRIRDENTTVFPEFDEALQSQIIQEWPRPAFYDTYVSMDLGYKDLTAVLFAYYDFKSAKLIIEDEIVLKGSEIQLPKLTESILQKEKDTFSNPLTYEMVEPKVRVSDINYLVTAEISRASGGKLNFMAARKDDKDSAINNLRTLLAEQRIIINPRCKNLIRHLRNAKWSKSVKKEFARSPDNGHYDAADAAVYLVRHVNFKHNPYPVGYGQGKDIYVRNKEAFVSQDPLTMYKKLFNVKR